MESGDGGINTALLAALPAARNVLELGCADGRLGERYKREHPAARWIGVDRNPAALRAAAARLDAALQLDLEGASLAGAGDGFDLVVLGDVLEHLREPEKVLTALRDVCADGAKLALCMPNTSHISVIERIVFGDIAYDDVGLLDRTHLRMFSPRSVFKMLLDCGWLPSAAGAYNARHPNERFSHAILDAAAALGISKEAAETNVFTYQLVIVCERAGAGGPAHEANANVSVLVRTTNETLLSLNAMRSPGLAEIGAKTYALRGVASAAAARAAFERQAGAEWLFFCGEDVYLPAGSGRLLSDLLQRIEPSDVAHALIGFAGVGLDARSQACRAGIAVDRFKLFDFPETRDALSIADWAVVMHRSCALAIDPELGWDLWATDLCVRSLAAGHHPYVPRIPIFHNAVAENDGGFARSAAHLAKKYPSLPAIPTFGGAVVGGTAPPAGQ